MFAEACPPTARSPCGRRLDARGSEHFSQSSGIGTTTRGLGSGDVLVCAITDPSWTPLFLAASAVVCDTGAVQSHAAIVARELGIPAVMSVPGITAVADGTPLMVDGDTGVVRVGRAAIR